MMLLTQLKSGDLKRVVKLLEQKEELQAQIEAIDRQLATFESGRQAPAPAQPAKKKVATPAPGRRRGSIAAKPPRRIGTQPPERGQLKAKITALVKEAGKAGITVKEIAAKVGCPAQRIHAWFNATGKNIKEIKRVRPATYAWQG